MILASNPWIEPLRRFAPGAVRRWLLSPDVRSLAERAERQRLAASLPLLDPRPVQGRALFPCVVQGIDGIDGLLGVVSAGPQAEGEPLDPALAARVERWLAMAAGVDPGVISPRLCVELPRQDFKLEGDSLGLAAVVAALSHILARPPRFIPVASACLDLTEPVQLGPVKGIAAKRAAVELELPGVQALIQEAPGTADPWLRDCLGQDWRARLVQALGVSPESLVEDAWQDYKKSDFIRTYRRASAAVSGAQGQVLGQALWLRGACLLHRGQEREALQELEAAGRALDAPPTPDEAPPPPLRRQELDAFLGVACLDNGAPARGIRILQGHIQAFEDLPDPLDLRTREVALQVAGTLHRLLVFDDRAEEALALQQRWLLRRARVKKELARAWGDIAEVERRLDHLEQAQAALDSAFQELPNANEGYRELTRRYLNLYRARAGMDPPEWAIQEPTWDKDPLGNLETLESLLAGPSADLDAWMDRWALETRLVERLVLAGVAARSLRTRSDVPAWIPTLVEGILSELSEPDPGVVQSLRALAQGDAASWYRRAPY